MVVVQTVPPSSSEEKEFTRGPRSANSTEVVRETRKQFCPLPRIFIRRRLDQPRLRLILPWFYMLTRREQLARVDRNWIWMPIFSFERIKSLNDFGDIVSFFFFFLNNLVQRRIIIESNRDKREIRMIFGYCLIQVNGGMVNLRLIKRMRVDFDLYFVKLCVQVCVNLIERLAIQVFFYKRWRE